MQLVFRRPLRFARCFISALAFASPQVAGADDMTANIDAMIKKIASEHSAPIRANFAEQLFRLHSAPRSSGH
jgi:hypothetical protein